MDPNKKTEALAHASDFEKSAETVRYLVENGADPKTAAQSDGYTPMHSAAYRGDLYIVQNFVRLGANPNAAKTNGWTVLHSAAYSSRLNVVQYLVGLGGDTVPINPKLTKATTSYPIGSTPLDMAKDQDVKDFLTKNGAKSGTPTPVGGNSKISGSINVSYIYPAVGCANIDIAMFELICKDYVGSKVALGAMDVTAKCDDLEGISPTVVTYVFTDVDTNNYNAYEQVWQPATDDELLDLLKKAFKNAGDAEAATAKIITTRSGFTTTPTPETT
jgi:hypothetical protein